MTVDTKAAELAPKEPSGIRTVAVLLVQIISMGFVVVTPAMAVFMQYFAEDAAATGMPIQLISTLPTLTTVIGILISGALVGKYVKHRTLAIIATLLFTIFGTWPAVFYDYGTVLICRALCGLGLGLLNPLASAIILGCYTGNKQANLLGWGTLVMNGGGIVLQTLGGILGGMDPTGQLVFWAHLFGIIAVVFAFLLPNPEIPATDSEGKKMKIHIHRDVWIMFVILFLFQMFNYPAMLNAGTILMGTGMDMSSAVVAAGMALNLFTIFGMVAGAIFGTVFKHIKKWIIPLGWILCALGILLVVTAGNVVMLCIGFSLLGIGFDFVLPAMTSWIGLVSNEASYPMSITVMQIGIQLGSFIATYWLQLLLATVGDIVYFPGYVECAFCVVFAIVFVFVNPFKRAENQEQASA
ncbi:MAG: MFS transporter [Coriobacteriales bacterium]|jgi:MFS family permease